MLTAVAADHQLMQMSITGAEDDGVDAGLDAT
jgi:hypothetical protein